MASNGGDSFFQPCVWSNAQSETCSESSPQLSSVDYGVISGKVDLIEAFFNSSLEFHGVTARQLTEESILSTASAAAVISQCQAAPWVSPELLKQENIVTSWGTSCPFQNQAVLNPGEEEGAGAVTTVVFSSCDNAPTNSYSRSASSGESENRDSCGSQRRAHRPQYYSNLQHQDELAVSQCSSNPPATRPGPPGTRPGLLKRKDHQEHMLRGGRYDLFGNIPLYDSSTAEGGFRIVFENTSKSNKKPRYPASADSCSEPDMEAIAQVKEMIYRAAALRPVALGAAEAAEKPRRRNVRISSDPQTVAARQRRERIGERLRVLQRLVPGGGRMDTASMLDEAANYLRFLKSQVTALQALGPPVNTCTSTPSASSSLHPAHSDHQFLAFPMQTHTSLQRQPPNVAPATAGAPFP